MCALFENFPAMSGQVRRAPGLVLLSVTVYVVPAVPADPRAASLCSCPNFGQDTFWTGNRSSPPTLALALVTEKPLSQLVELALLCQGGLDAFKSRLASQALTGLISYGWSCCPALCWLVPLVLHTGDELPGREQGRVHLVLCICLWNVFAIWMEETPAGRGRVVVLGQHCLRLATCS